MKPPIAPARYVGPGLLIHDGMTRKEARRAILKAGGKWLSGGSYAGVVQAPNPDADRVIRISKPDRGAELAYSVFQEFPGHPNAPRIYGLVKLVNGGMAVEVERLFAKDDVETDDLRGGYEVEAEWKRSTTDPLAMRLQDLVDEDTVDWDLHGDNIRFRKDGTLVAVDPLYGPEDHDVRSGTAMSYENGSIERVAFEASALKEDEQEAFDVDLETCE